MFAIRIRIDKKISDIPDMKNRPLIRGEEVPSAGHVMRLQNRSVVVHDSFCVAHRHQERIGSTRVIVIVYRCCSEQG